MPGGGAELSEVERATMIDQSGRPHLQASDLERSSLGAEYGSCTGTAVEQCCCKGEWLAVYLVRSRQSTYLVFARIGQRTMPARDSTYIHYLIFEDHWSDDG